MMDGVARFNPLHACSVYLFQQYGSMFNSENARMSECTYVGALLRTINRFARLLVLGLNLSLPVA